MKRDSAEKGNPPALRLVSSSSPRQSTNEPPRRGEPSAWDDSELLAAVRRGDASAARALYDRCRPVVDRTIARLLGKDDPDRPDVAQLASIEIVRSLTNFRGECSFDGWISRITARAVYRTIRSRRTERQYVAPTELEEGAGPGDLAGDVERRSLLERVRRHLDRLDGERAFSFVLHDVWGYDLKEVAEITQVSVAAAQSRLVRGRRELHERLAHDPSLAAELSAEQKRRGDR